MTGLICPYCRTNIGTGDEPLVCEGCGTAHHADCYAENGGCTIFGCSRAPGDEPKVSVSSPELVAVAVPAMVVETRLPLLPQSRHIHSQELLFFSRYSHRSFSALSTRPIPTPVARSVNP